jgi:RNA polymerase sigma-70 factor, ECF subfamily
VVHRIALGRQSPVWKGLWNSTNKLTARPLSELIEALSRILYRFLASQLGSRAEAEDLLQEVLLKIHKSRNSYRKGQPLLPWAFAIARHVRVDDYRRRRRTSMRETSLNDVTEPMSCPAPSRHSIPELKTLMADMPESQREVLTMLKVSGLSVEEIARAASSTVGAVKQKAHRAYGRLRLLLTESPTSAG